ncbi:NAD(P)-binding domain-containing protein, partial [Salmonella enterica subsp. enterica serovar Minnesota]|nr:NAD(P)-binding domain-containing protein [Salmonella enterica subsp. enterica serovar Minnesota]
VTNRSAAKAATLDGIAGLASIALEAHPDANLTAAAGADIVLIGVKPAMVPDLLEAVAPVLRPGTIVVSLAAGVTVATFERILGD